MTNPDPLRAFHGIVNAVLLSLPMWAVLALLYGIIVLGWG